jgi:hypothetical protein
MNKFRSRVLAKLGQTQPAQPTTTPAPVLGPPPAAPSELFVHLNEGYNANTVNLISGLVRQLNAALHYASQGQDNFQNIIGNNSKFSGGIPDHKNVGMIAKRVFDTFLNKRNSFGNKLVANSIHNWADGILSSAEFSNLSQVKPTSDLANKLSQDPTAATTNLKSSIQILLDQIKAQNPVTP